MDSSWYNLFLRSFSLTVFMERLTVTFKKDQVFSSVFFLIILFSSFSGIIAGSGLKIKDYRQHLNRRFEKKKRLSTRYIIIHTSEAGLVSTLRTLSRGKKVGRSRTKGGHSHYAIARDGKIFRILSHKYRADHTGLSMWNGVTDISSHSLGIELVGYHFGTITKAQYRSLERLLEVLKRIYGITDKNILSHCQVAYGRPNLWFKRDHRGRKRCARNFERQKVGLTDSWAYDPDVRAKRLAPDPQIHRLFYGSQRQKTILAAKRAMDQRKRDTDRSQAQDIGTEVSNVITSDNTAWTIAGEDYDSAHTVYLFPNGSLVRGDKISKKVGWDKLPPGTQVLVNQPLGREKVKGPIFRITGTYTAWSFAGIQYRKATTFYFYPNGRILPGDLMSDWDSLPDHTCLIIGYKGPYIIEAEKGKTAWGIAGAAYQSPDTIYFLPDRGLVPGDQIKDFANIPKGTRIFLKLK